jgi:hypothetical protein
MRWIARVALLAVLAPCTVAHADGDGYERLYRAAGDLFDAGRYREARAQYEAAYAIEPRPIIWFNIASTYRREGDRLNARLFYQRYLDAAGPDAPMAALAKKTIGELDAELLRTTQAPPPATPTLAPPAIYPRDAIARPLALPAGMLGFAAGGVVETFEGADAAGDVATRARGFAAIGARYGAASRVEVAGALDLGIPDVAHSFVFAQVTGAVLSGRWSIAIRAGIAFDIEDRELFDVRFAVPLQLRVAERIAIVSDDDALRIALDHGSQRVIAALPLGIGAQVADGIFVTLVGRAPQYAAAARVLVAMTDSVDVVARVQVSAPRTEGSVAVERRW